jgi:hypothetical protein
MDEEQNLRDEGPLAERRQRRAIRLPLRYRDVPPEPPAALSPPSSAVSDVSANNFPVQLSVNPTSGFVQPQAQLQRILQSPRNIFGLFRQYRGVDFPSHDPEEYVTSDELSDIRCITSSLPDETAYSPYPNQSSFALGEWYWCHGVQKSKESFKDLVRIITDPKFQTSDIQDTSWDHIDRQLGGDPEKEAEWIDEPDAGWDRTSVTILVPFPRSAANPGTREYTVPNFYHRSIVSILRERLTSSSDFPHFHLAPYKLFWQPGNMPEPVQVHGELYNSQAFLEAYDELQNSPMEPGCVIERVVVGLMFASDETHLTAFNNEKLWPLYMFFGNDSKYRRCKPSLSLCNHVAYFQKVRNSPCPVILFSY